MSDELPPGWESVPLARVGRWAGGGTPSKSVREYWDNGTVDWVSPKDMKRLLIDSAQDQVTEKAVRESATSLIPANSVLMVTRSGILEHTFPIAVNTVPVAVNQDLKALSPRAGIDAVYVAYFLKSREQDILRVCSKDGTTVSSIDSDRLTAYNIWLAPSAEQQRIVAKIDELFSRIDEGERALERVQQLVEHYRQSVLKAAVTGELSREWREKNVGKFETGEALLARILDARRVAWEKAQLGKMKSSGIKSTNNKWKGKYEAPASPDTSELVELPDGWVWATPVQLEAAVPNALAIGPFGSNLRVADYVSSGVPLIFVRNIRSQDFDSDSAKYVSSAKALELSSHVARGGDILITKMGDPPGDACVYPDYREEAVITADCIKWTLHPLIEAREYIASFINSSIGRSQFAGITKGVAQQKVSLDRFRRIAIALPGLDEQREIAERLEVELQRLQMIKTSIEVAAKRAAAARQSVLGTAFKGRLVAQNADDEPATALLERIASERTVKPASSPRGRGRGRKSRA